jgi:formylglycine-generating enzyme
MALAWVLFGLMPGGGCGQETAPVPPAPPQPMVRLAGGSFEMGTEEGFPHEGPVHTVRLDPFEIDPYEVTNAEFAAFVEATDYRTVAEREGWSGVFDSSTGAWKPVTGADWRHPEGPGSHLAGRERFPVVQVCYDDALAYADWAGKRLPTEAEWEFAARGGLEGMQYPWGDELRGDGASTFPANYWQGLFPQQDLGEDGFTGLAPVGSFPPNGFGLYDLAGNAWEWVRDAFSPTYYAESPTDNPQGPPPGGPEFVIRGGSFLCSENFCTGYRVAARNKTDRDSATNHMGFRCAR